MRDTVRLGRLAGVQIGLNWSLMAMAALVAGGLAQGRFSFEAPGYSGAAYALAGGLTATGLLVGVLLHELGHAIVARWIGLKVDGITLSWMGGVTRIEGEAARPGSELVVAGVGPAVSAAFGGLLWAVRLVAESLGVGSLAIAALGWLAVINILLAAFNLLPAAPLDGGRVLHSAVWAATRDRWKATRVAATGGVGLGALLVAAGFVLAVRTHNPINGLLTGIIGWWLLGSARAELNVATLQHALEGVQMSDVMRPVGAAPGWITVRNFAESYAGSRPGWVWLLESWGGGYGGILLGDSLSVVPLPQWDLVRPLDVAMPISNAAEAKPGDDTLTVMAQMADKQVILVVDGGHTVGAVLPGDVEALVQMAARGRVVQRHQPATGRTR
jgi:Zn-dependent protease